MTDNPEREQTTPGHTAERVGFFTDAVFAIAMTLLVIEIPRPEAEDFEAAGSSAAGQRQGQKTNTMTATRRMGKVQGTARSPGLTLGHRR